VKYFNQRAAEQAGVGHAIRFPRPAARLAQSGWLKKFGRGVYQMPNAKLDIQGHTTVCEHNLSKNIQVPVLSHFELFGSKFVTGMDR